MTCVSEQNPDRLGFRASVGGARTRVLPTTHYGGRFKRNFQIFQEATQEATEIYAENESPGPTVPATKSTPHTTTILRYLKVLDRYTQTQ